MNEIIIVNKPKGITSRDVVNKISKILKTKKVGHNGTLDPLATGVLVITTNRYTKLNNLLSSREKEYIAEVKIGIETDTLDITGNIIEKKEEHLDINKLEETLKKYKKTYMQEVPKYSAVKVNGKSLREWSKKRNELLKIVNKDTTFRLPGGGAKPKTLAQEKSIVKFVEQCIKVGIKIDSSLVINELCRINPEMLKKTRRALRKWSYRFLKRHNYI